MAALRFGNAQTALRLRCVFTAALFADQASKYWARRFLPVSALHHNYGISFSLFKESPRVGFFIALSGLLFLLAVLWRFKRLRLSLGGALLLAGTTGNFIDRMLWGYVIDWIDVGVYIHAHIRINVADIWLSIGGLLSVLCAIDDP